MRQGLEGFQDFCIKTFVTSPGLVVHNDTSADCFTGRWTAQNVTIAAYRDDWISQLQLNPALFAGLKLFTTQQAQRGNSFTRAHKEFHFTVVKDGCGTI